MSKKEMEREIVKDREIGEIDGWWEGRVPQVITSCAPVFNLPLPPLGWKE